MSLAPERIAFVELWRLGDSIAATAGLLALRAARPNAEIAVVTHPQYGEPLRRTGVADRIIPFAAFWTRGKLLRDKYLPWTIDYGALARAWRSLREFRAHTYLLFRGDIREQLFCLSLRTGVVVDRTGGPTRSAPGVRVFPTAVNVPRYREYVQQVRLWSGAAIDTQPILGGVDRKDAIKGPGVIVHPGASWKYKQWSAAKTASLLDILQERAIPTVLVGGETDRDFMAEVQSLCSIPVRAAVPELGEFFDLVAAADAVVCNNSAALHIAEAVGTPCVALTGSSDPVRWGTYSSRSRTVCFSVGLPCHPCGEKRCVRPDRPCIEEIEVHHVVSALRAIGIPLGAAECGPAAEFESGARS
jgi:ADP-heptose:LPS heptosyltransferase